MKEIPLVRCFLLKYMKNILTVDYRMVSIKLCAYFNHICMYWSPLIDFAETLHTENKCRVEMYPT
jgi:hypothetical protein